MIQVTKLKKSFTLDKKQQKKVGKSKVEAVKSVSFRCEAGEVMALLGSNGAGKTTTLRLLSTALEVDDGEIWLNETAVHKYPRRARSDIGFLSNGTPLYRRLTVFENLAFFGKLYGMDARAIKLRIEQLAQQLGFQSYLHQKVDGLSSGMDQKANIARSIMHNPHVIILDEPTTGLDVRASQQILDFIVSQKENGKTILFSTHHMNEVEMLADKICIIDKGVSVFCGSQQQLLQGSEKPNVTEAFLTQIEGAVA